MAGKITPGILVVASILVIAIALLGTFVVTANFNPTTTNQNTENSLKLIPTLENVEDDSDDEFEEEDVPITGSDLERASQAALNAIGEGRVTDSEIGDEDGYYEIEITLDDGSEVDVHLDENFNVISKEYEDEEEDDDD